MNIVQYFKQGAEFWVAKINTEGRLTDDEVKLASEFCSNAFKWDCDSSGERVAKELQNKGYVTYIPAEERIFLDKIGELLYNDVFQITVNYIRTYAPELYNDSDLTFTVRYTDDKGNTFERKVAKYDKHSPNLQYYRGKFEEIREEARIWLMQQNEVQK